MLTGLRAWYAAANTLYRQPESGQRSEPWTTGTISAAIAVILLYVLSRVFWWLRFGPLGFGYDTGIYRHVIGGYWEKRGQGLPAFGFTHLTNALQWLGLSTDFILLGGYMASAALLGLAVYVVLKNHRSRQAGLFGLFLLTISLTQLEFYHWFYYRNLLAAALVLLAIAAWPQRPWLAGIWLGLVGIIHPVSLVPAVLAFGIWAVVKKDRWTTGGKIIGIAALITLVFNWGEWIRYIEPLVQYRGLATKAVDTSPEFTGQFITIIQWLKWSWPYLWLAVPGVWLVRRRLSPLWWLGVVAGIGIIAQVLFFRRLIVWLDLAALLAAAVFLDTVWSRTRMVRVLTVVAASIGLMFAGHFVYKQTPAMSEIDWLTLQQLNQLPPRSLVLTISPQYAPWLYGYTNQRIIAPGMLDENVWNRSQWDTFWFTPNPAERVALLSQYQAPQIYIFVAQNQLRFLSVLSDDSLFVPVTSQIWQFKNQNYPQAGDKNNH